jgi:UbiD family decarboxylase
LADQSLRGFISELEASNELHRVTRQVHIDYELGAVLALRDGDASQLFQHIAGHDMPVVGNLLNSRERIAKGLGVPSSGLQTALLDALDHRIEPELVSDAPVQEVVIKREIDLVQRLPVPRWFEQEAGPYITAGVIVAKHPDTGRRNVSIARLRLEGGNRLMAGVAKNHHLSMMARRAYELGQRLEIAVAIGNHPAVLVASQMYLDLGDDEYTIAGALLKEPLRLVKCKTVDLEVPADAEIVIEGSMSAGDLIEEGPVSEFPGFYVSYGPGTGVSASALTHRRRPTFQTILPGYAREHCLLGAVAIGATVCRALRRTIPSVRRVFVTDGSMGRLHAIITMHKPARGEGKRAALLAIGQVNLLKLLIVVDDDIDPENWTEVEWALAARFRGEEDLLVLPGLKADRCEPMERNLTVTKICMIATTRPADNETNRQRVRASAPQEILDRVRKQLADY